MLALIKGIDYLKDTRFRWIGQFQAGSSFPSLKAILLKTIRSLSIKRKQKFKIAQDEISEMGFQGSFSSVTTDMKSLK